MKNMNVIMVAYLFAHVAYYISSEIFFGTGTQIVPITWTVVGMYYLFFQISISGVY